jgi:uncharacterized protein YdcH (DUF465 family)
MQRNIMLHEYRDEIHDLKQSNAQAEIGDAPMTDVELETLKKEKLLLEDEAYKIIMDYRKTKA